MNNQQISDILLDSLTFLELPVVLDDVGSYACSIPGKDQVRSALPEDDLDVIKANLELVSELREMIPLWGRLELNNLLPMERLFESLDIQSTVLEVEEIQAIGVLLEICESVLERLDELDDRLVQLKSFLSTIVSIGRLKQRIFSTIDEHGNVRPNASPELARIHSRGRATRELVMRRLESFVRDRDLERIVQEDYVTLRNDRYVILLRPEFRGLLDGIVHDHSRSGASVYVEPFQVIELNNQIASLVDEERAEIRQIIKSLTQDIRAEAPDLISNWKALVLLDAFQARALYSLKTSSIIPELVGEGFRIVGARHPLLLADSQARVVPMDVIQDPVTSATIISGPNMGGKTVALKIAGLFPLMIKCGIPIPAAEGTQIQPFKQIMADIGDEQDLRARVSSFAGHMLRIKAILGKASPGDLVLLDELGGATDPEEGSALAMAIVDELIDRRSNTVVTTHLTQLKVYAMARDLARNVSVEFHPNTLQPTFRLLYDFPGESHAILTAEHIGLSQSVLESARRYADRSAGGSTKLLQELREKVSQTETIRRDLASKTRDLEQELQDVQFRRDQIIEEFRIRCLDMVHDAEIQIAGIQKSLKSHAVRTGAKPREALARLKEQMVTTLGRPLEKTPQKPELGATVRLLTLGKTGKVTSYNDSGLVEVAVGNVTVKAHASDIELVSDAREEKKSSKKERIGLEIPITHPRWEVKIIGLRVDEALPIVERAIDEAVLAGLTSISIIHGRGTGRLKKAVRDYLAKNKLVREFHSGDFHGGGEAVTVVELAFD